MIQLEQNKEVIPEDVDFKDSELNIDIIGVYEGDLEVDLSIYMIRRGVLIGHRNFYFPQNDVQVLIELIEVRV